jgi:hypothetical protein
MHTEGDMNARTITKATALQIDVDQREKEFFQHCRENYDGGVDAYGKDAVIIEELAKTIDVAAFALSLKYNALGVARDWRDRNGRTVHLTTTPQELIERICDALEMGEEAASLLLARVAVLGESA